MYDEDSPWAYADEEEPPVNPEPAYQPEYQPPPEPVQQPRPARRGLRIGNRRVNTEAIVSETTADSIVKGTVLGMGVWSIWTILKARGRSTGSPKNSRSMGGSGPVHRAGGGLGAGPRGNMSTEMQQEVRDIAQSTAERWERYDYDDIEDVLTNDVLDIDVIADMDHEARGFRLVTGVGGPFVRVDLQHNEVYVAWGGDTAEWSIIGNDDVLDAFEDRLYEQWEATR